MAMSIRYHAAGHPRGSAAAERKCWGRSRSSGRRFPPTKGRSAQRTLTYGLGEMRCNHSLAGETFPGGEAGPRVYSLRCASEGHILDELLVEAALTGGVLCSHNALYRYQS